MFSDAWFDLLTAHRGGDILVSAATAIFGEIPIGIVLAMIAAKLLRAAQPATTSRRDSRIVVTVYPSATEIYGVATLPVPTSSRR